LRLPGRLRLVRIADSVGINERVSRGGIDNTVGNERSHPETRIDGYGTMSLKIGPDSAGNVQITKTSETGTGFGNTVWTRCTPGFRAG
jgi:hypothetical protein